MNIISCNPGNINYFVDFHIEGIPNNDKQVGYFWTVFARGEICNDPPEFEKATVFTSVQDYIDDDFFEDDRITPEIAKQYASLECEQMCEDDKLDQSLCGLQKAQQTQRWYAYRSHEKKIFGQDPPGKDRPSLSLCVVVFFCFLFFFYLLQYFCK